MTVKTNLYLKICAVLIGGFFFISYSATGQDEPVEEDQLARPAFESAQLIDNHSSYVYQKGTLEMNIQHRFGLMNNGISDVFGIFGPSNIRLGFAYAPIDKLNVGFGYTKNKQYLDLNAKYAIFQQTRSWKVPVNVTYYGNVAFDLRDGSNFLNTSDRVSFFNQLIFSRRITPKLSAQVAPSVSHFNVIEGYITREGEVEGTMKNNHYAIHIGGRYKISSQTSIVAAYDQPLTEHLTNNPHPNLSFGVEIATSSHAFQIFFTNYNALVPQENNMFNANDYQDGDFMMGFNITRLWSF